MNSDAWFYVGLTIIIVLTLGTPDLLDGFIAMANGCKL